MKSLRPFLALALPGLPLVAAFHAFIACGSNGGGPSPAADASSPGTEAGASDGGQDGSSSPPDAAFDVALPSSGTGTLAGFQAFPVGKVTLFESPSNFCQGTPYADGGVIPAVQMLFSSQGLPADFPCDPDAGLPEAGAGQTLLDIEVATTEWAMYAPSPLTQSLTPGTYSISNEHEDDEDLCMLTPGGSAILQIYPPGGNAPWIGVSGTVTLASVTAGSATGSFDVLLGPPFGDGGASPTMTLTGTFNAALCP